jgi:hypothetical protein
MIELVAAIAGAAITWAAMGSMGFSRRNDQAREAVIRLTAGVQNIATQLQILHTDIRDNQKETFGRLNGVEHRVTKLEASGTWDGRNRRQ